MLEEIRPRVVWGPEHHAGDGWGLAYPKADYRGRRVGLGGSSTEPRFLAVGVGGVRYRSAWTTEPASASGSSGRARAMPEEDLVRYKPAAGRGVYLQDVEQTENRRRAGDKPPRKPSPGCRRARSTGTGVPLVWR